MTLSNEVPNNSYNEFAYRLDLLERINSVVIEGVPVCQWRIAGNYNVWSFFQTRLFFDDLKGMSQSSIAATPALTTKIKERVLLVVAGAVTLAWAVLLALRRARVLVYAIDRTTLRAKHSDARMEPVYTALERENVAYTEALHTVLGRGFVRNLFMRRRLALYIKGVDFWYRIVPRRRRTVDWSAVDLSAFSSTELPLVRQTLEKYLSQIPLVEFRVKFLTHLLRWSGLAAVFAIDNTRDYNELVLAAKLCGIPVFAFQHGHYTKYHVGWLTGKGFTGVRVKPDRLYVWSDYWRDELLRLGTYFSPEEIVVGGLKEPLTDLLTPEAPAVVIPYEADSDKRRVKEFIDSMLGCGIPVLLKLRADIPAAEQYRASLLSGPAYHPLFFAAADQREALRRSGVVAGTYSTYLYDMVAYGRPVVLLDSSNDFGEGVARNGLAARVSLDDAVCLNIRAAMATPGPVLLERRRLLCGDGKLLMQETAAALARTYA